MLPLMTAAFAYDGVPQWDDPVLDRAPREQTVSLAEGLVIGSTGFSNTRLQVGLTPLSKDRVGLGLTLSSQLNTVWVSAEDRVGAGIGGNEAALHVWFSPRKHLRTSHDIYAGVSAPLATTAYLVRVDDVFTGLRLGYGGYYEFGQHLDVSLDLHAGIGAPPGDPLGVFGSVNLTFLGSPNRDDWVLLGGADVSVTTQAAVVGARKRFGEAWEGGAALIVPVRTVYDASGELPLWPVVDLRARF